MTQRAQERELAGRGDAGRRGSGLREFLGMALAAGCLCLAVARPELGDDVVHTLATRAVELAR
ncbi:MULTISPECIES: hypothetical protein [unclassified Streptomyces]|uniref:hypothetical protein n=1 Tax=unclassified Streptomyces TaxID=2593676 RepID=UPI0033A0BDFE